MAQKRLVRRSRVSGFPNAVGQPGIDERCQVDRDDPDQGDQALNLTRVVPACTG